VSNNRLENQIDLDRPEKQIDLFQKSAHRDLYVAIGNIEFSYVQSQLKPLLQNPSREILILAVLATVSNSSESLERRIWAASMYPLLNIVVLYDPQEDDSEKRSYIEAAQVEADGSLAEGPNVLGSCNAAWAIQKQILREKYGIDWQTPAEMNPGCRFD